MAVSPVGGTVHIPSVTSWMFSALVFSWAGAKCAWISFSCATSPYRVSGSGLVAQEREIQAHFAPAQEKTNAENIQLVTDGMWTVPPTGETATEYLTDYVEEDGVRIATNMSDTVRYHAMANTDYPSRNEFDAPHVSLQAETVMPESLITSIQPHYQVPHAPDLPEYFRYALRVAGPLLALGVNSPFFPPDLYDDAPDCEVLDDAHMEHRVGVFESVLNPPEGHEEPPKVCFPPDFGTVEDAIDDIAADTCIVPMDVTPADRFDDAFAHFRHKHGSYWRWVRPVFDGATRSEANARIEFRPLPAQPTIRDCVAFEAVFAGLMESLPRFEHPVRRLDWETAEDNFYAAARDGLQADIAWLTTDGAETTDIDVICNELFEYARDGLEGRGLSAEQAHEYIRPLRERLDRRTTPARWKHERVRSAVEVSGTPTSTADRTRSCFQRAGVVRRSSRSRSGRTYPWACSAERPRPSRPSRAYSNNSLQMTSISVVSAPSVVSQAMSAWRPSRAAA